MKLAFKINLKINISETNGPIKLEFCMLLFLKSNIYNIKTIKFWQFQNSTELSTRMQENKCVIPVMICCGYVMLQLRRYIGNTAEWNYDEEQKVSSFHSDHGAVLQFFICMFHKKAKILYLTCHHCKFLISIFLLRKIILYYFEGICCNM